MVLLAFLVEWWYNSSYHTSLNMTPFQAVYGFKPSMVVEVIIHDCLDLTAQEQRRNRQVAQQVIKENLLKAQARIKHQADKHRVDMEFSVGDMVYLKIRPYRHTSLSTHNSLKLHSKFYGPFRVLERIGKAAYKLTCLRNKPLGKMHLLSARFSLLSILEDKDVSKGGIVRNVHLQFR
jgi:hypothetical protein